jgi:outer membrane immunogenic protein
LFGDVLLRKLLGIVGLSGLLITTHLSAATGADMPVKAPPPAPASSWTGFYVGANFGYGWEQEYLVRTDTNALLNFPPGTSTTINDRGVLGGGQIGFDYQWNRLVFGVQGTFDAANLTGGSSILGAAGTAFALESSKISSLFDAGARVGYAWSEQFLPYVKGGAAWMQHSAVANSFMLPSGAYYATSTGSESHTGWFVGSGLEYRFVRNWSAFIEYDYYGGFGGNANRITIVDLANPALVGLPTDHTYQANINVLKIGLNWRP